MSRFFFYQPDESSFKVSHDQKEPKYKSLLFTSSAWQVTQCLRFSCENREEEIISHHKEFIMINVSLISTKGSDHNLLLVKALPSFPVRTHQYLLLQSKDFRQKREDVVALFWAGSAPCWMHHRISQYLCEVPLFRLLTFLCIPVRNLTVCQVWDCIPGESCSYLPPFGLNNFSALLSHSSFHKITTLLSFVRLPGKPCLAWRACS